MKMVKSDSQLPGKIVLFALMKAPQNNENILFTSYLHFITS